MAIKVNGVTVIQDSPRAITNLETALSAGQGGTGRNTLTANNILLGDGTNQVKFVAPGSNGNLLSSDGNTWTSVSPTDITLGPNGASSNTQTFSTPGSSTWTKPGTGTFALVRCWGGGGSGARGSGGRAAGGGGGGAFSEKLFRLSDLTATVAVTVGAGGAGQTTNNTVGNTGGNTTFGAFLTAFGGGAGGTNNVGGNGGGGGGGGSAGTSGGTGTNTRIAGGTSGIQLVMGWIPNISSVNSSGTASQTLAATGNDRHSEAGGEGGAGNAVNPSCCLPNPLSRTGGSGNFFGGGGGGGGRQTNALATDNVGGNSVWGGGGGGGAAISGPGTGGNGGTSTYGGAGSAGAIDANASANGTQPGGGSGGAENANSGNGGDGRCIVYVF